MIKHRMGCFVAFFSLKKKKTSAVKFLDLIFRNNFFVFNFSKRRFAMKVVEENFRQLLQKILCLWRKQIFMYIDEDYAII